MILEYNQIKPGMIVITHDGQLYLTFDTTLDKWGVIGVNNDGWITLRNTNSNFTPVAAYLALSPIVIKGILNEGINSIDLEDLETLSFTKVLPEKKFLTKAALEKLIGFEFEIIEED